MSKNATDAEISIDLGKVTTKKPDKTATNKDDATAIVRSIENKDCYSVLTDLVDEEVCNPLKIWHDLGEPKYPSDAQVEMIKKGSRPLAQSMIAEAKAGKVTVNFKLGAYGIRYFTIKPLEVEGDAGYDFEKIEKISCADLKKFGTKKTVAKKNTAKETAAKKTTTKKTTTKKTVK